MKKKLLALCATALLFSGCFESSGTTSGSGTSTTSGYPQGVPSYTTSVTPGHSERTTESASEEADVKHEMVCPYSAAEIAQAYKELNAAHVKRIKRSLTKGSGSEATWSFAKVEAQEAAGLTNDSKRDYKNTNKTYLIVAPTGDGSNVDVTFIAYPYGDDSKPPMYLKERMYKSDIFQRSSTASDPLRAILPRRPRIGSSELGGFSPNPFQPAERNNTVVMPQPRTINVLPTIDVLGRMGDATFSVVEYSGQVSEKDLIVTNTIFIESSDMPKRGDFRRFQLINERLLSSLPEGDLGQLSVGETLLITAVRNSSNEELVTIFEPVSQSEPLVAHTFNLAKGRAASISRFKKLLTQKLKGLNKGGRVYVYGDNVSSLNIADAIYEFDVELVRRPITITKNIAATDRKLVGSFKMRFDPETTVISDGIPVTEDHLRAMGLPLYDLEEWVAQEKNIRAMVEGRHRRIIRTKQEFIDELQYGESDEIMLFAHSNGDRIYFGEESVSKEEIEALPPRQTPHTRTRMAMIISCEFGSLSEGRSRWLLWRQPKSFAELLIEKNYFDSVVAPDHLVKHSEAKEIIRMALTGATMRSIHKTRPGWNKVATLNQRDNQTKNNYETQHVPSQS